RVIRDGLALDSRVLSLRNIQMFQTLIASLERSNNRYRLALNEYDHQLDSLKGEILAIRRDTVLRHLYHDTLLRQKYTNILKPIRQKWRDTDTLVRKATAWLNTLRSHASENDITLKELAYQTDRRLTELGPRAFSQEVPYLWETVRGKNRRLLVDYSKSSDNLNAAAGYYFRNTRSQRLWLIGGGLLIFFWVWWNFRSVKRRDKMPQTEMFHFLFVRPLPFATAFVVMLTLAPLTDLNAPAIYLEAVEFSLMIILTIVFWRRWPRDLFYGWCIIIALFLIIPLGNLLNVPFTAMRWVMFLVDVVAFGFGAFFFRHIFKADIRIRPNLLLAAGFYTFFMFAASVANLSGRLTLTKIFGTTAVYGFAQMISLTVFVRIITEAFLLQIFASRLRRGYNGPFVYAPIQKNLDRAATVLSIILWLIVFTTNLNLYDTIVDALQSFLLTRHQIGRYQFTLWAVLLFGGIIWLANYLQKYIALFFGDTGEDVGIDVGGARSRLLLTRLVLLIGGFMLAVVASGLPVDRITVILGALSVGIGLGLQNIVSNFVSGIILIFDRPLRIGDVVELGDKKGRVKEIGVRASTLVTADGSEVIIPNGNILSQNIVNWTLTNNPSRVVITVSVEDLPDEDAIRKEIAGIICKNDNVSKDKDP
ncbi:MAG: mechanosensitive ion channel, partial [Mucilaginibacter polytrichastri]|nr:mechanosensitive ion channel [Mucilaginibacter polytrichastri]